MTIHLDPQAQALLDASGRARLLPLPSLTVPAARERMRNGFMSHGPGPDLAEVRDLTIPGPGGGTPARLYSNGPTDQPLLVFFHGGGWVLNDLDTHDRLCRILAKSGHFSIVSVDYRRAPEHSYPAPLEDAMRAWLFCVSNARLLGVDTERVAVGGDSSGATLAFGVSALALDLGFRVPDLQLLLYPVADHYQAGSESYRTFGTGYSLDAASMIWFWDNYLAGASWSPDDGYLFPLRRKDLTGLPPSIVSVAGFDPLHTEGSELIRRLVAANVSVESIPAGELMHGWAMQTKTIDRAARLVDIIASRTGAVLRGAGLQALNVL